MPRVYNGTNNGDYHTGVIPALSAGTSKLSFCCLLNFRDTVRSTPFAIDCEAGNGNVALNLDCNSSAGRFGISRFGSGTAQARYAATDSLGSGSSYRNKGWHWIFATIDSATMVASQIALYCDSSTECTYGTGLDTNGTGTLFGRVGAVSTGYRYRAGVPNIDRWFNGCMAYLALWDDYLLTTGNINSILGGTAPSDIQAANLKLALSYASGTTPEVSTGSGAGLITSNTPVTRVSTYLPTMRALTSGTPVSGLVAYLDAASLAYSDDAVTAITNAGNLQRWDCELGGTSGVANTATMYMATASRKPKWYAATTNPTRNAYINFGVEPSEGMTYPSAVGGMLRNSAALYNLSARAHTVLLIGACAKPCATGTGSEWMWDQTLLGAGDFNVGVEGSQDNGGGSGVIEYGYMGESATEAATAWNYGTVYVVGNVRSRFGRSWYCTANHTSTADPGDTGSDGPNGRAAVADEPGRGSDYNAQWTCRGAWAATTKVVPPCTPCAMAWRATADTTIKVQRALETAVSVTRSTEAAASATNAAFTLGGTAAYLVAASGGGYQYPGSFMAHAILLWNRALSDAEITAVITALSPLYNATTAPTTIVGMEGSSSSAGYFRTGNRNVLWDSPKMDTTRLGFMFSRGGDDIISGGGADLDAVSQTGPVDSIATLTSDVRIFVQQDSNGLVAQLGDGQADTVNPGNIMTALTTWVANRRTAGYDKVYAVPILSRTCANIPLFNTRRAILNTSLRAAVGTTFDRIADIAGDATLGDDAAYLGVHYADQTHLDDSGFALAQPYYDGVLTDPTGGASKTFYQMIYRRRRRK